jgi:hypothetical protein
VEGSANRKYSPEGVDRHLLELAQMPAKLLGRIARKRSQSGVVAEGEQDNRVLWNKIRYADENLSHCISARIVQFAKTHGASILVFEHLGKLKPEKGKDSPLKGTPLGLP